MPDETLVLDGLTFTGGTGTLMLESLSASPPSARYEWINAADSEGSALLRGPQHENREVSFKLRVQKQASMDLALNQIGLVRDKLAKAERTPTGIPMTWNPAGSTRTVTFDVLAGSIEEMPIGWDGDAAGWFLQTPVITVKLMALPYWRGMEVTGTAVSAATPMVTTEVASVPGDVPALGRLIVTDNATQARRHVEWGLEGPATYNAATSLTLDSDSLVTAGFAGTQTTRAGAFDPDAVGNNVIRASIPVIRNTAVCGTGTQAHVGTFRVKARVYVSSMETRVRFAWQEGDGPFSANGWVTPQVAVGFCELDLGPITINPAASGTQAWQGRIEAFHLFGTVNLDVDYLELIPASNGYGKARAVELDQSTVLVGSDDFTTTTAGGALNARTAPLGGAWATSGAATDFTFADGPGSGEESVTRASGVTGARFALLGATNYANVDAGLFVQTTGAVNTAAQRYGLLLRYVDASNYAWVGLRTATPYDQLVISIVVAGVRTDLAANYSPIRPDRRWWDIRVVAYASGNIIARMFIDQAPTLKFLYSDSRLATGGTLASGRVGILDDGSTGNAISRFYDNFYVATPQPEPIVVNSGRKIEFRSDDTLRTDTTGTIFGRPPSYRGGRFLLQPGTSRVAVKARRQDVEVTSDDSVTDSTTVQVAYTPRGLVVPR